MELTEEDTEGDTWSTHEATQGHADDEVHIEKPKGKKNAMDPSGEHPLKRLGPKSLVCSACKTAAKQFQGKVARKIKGKWKQKKKRETFEANLPGACAASAYPEEMIIFSYRGQNQTLGDKDALMRAILKVGKNVSADENNPEVKIDFLEACRHLLLVEFKDALLEKLLSNPKRDGQDIDFSKWLCGPQQAQVCDEGVDSGEDSEDEADEDL